MSDYNGWKNWETWNLHLHVSNDEYRYHEARMEALSGVDALEEWSRDYVWQSIGIEADNGFYGPAADFINASLAEVDYRELREALLE